MPEELPSFVRSKANGYPRRKFLLGAAAIGMASVRRPAGHLVTAPTARLAASDAAANAKKGVGAWTFTGVNQALADSGVSWYYTWSYNTAGITTPADVEFVPMIWGTADVNAAALSQAKQAGSTLLGFNEPDNANQSDMTVAEALSLWPQLMATGMTLGSPAVASNAATPGSWLSQFMRGAAVRKYPVNFIAVHWYGSAFATATAVAQLKNYLRAIYAMYGLPLWLTEFALVNWSTNTYPTESQQAAFATAATSMLQTLSYVQRYAWFALPVNQSYGNTGLYNSGPVATPVGLAYQAVDAT
jgi:Glycosyl hydrolase catalytic core